MPTAGCSLEDGCRCPWQDAGGRVFPEQKCPRCSAEVTKLLSLSKGKRQKPSDLLGAAGLSTSTTPLIQEGVGPGRATVSYDMLPWTQDFPLLAQLGLVRVSGKVLRERQSCSQPAAWVPVASTHQDASPKLPLSDKLPSSRLQSASQELTELSQRLNEEKVVPGRDGGLCSPVTRTCGHSASEATFCVKTKAGSVSLQGRLFTEPNHSTKLFSRR